MVTSGVLSDLKRTLISKPLRSLFNGAAASDTIIFRKIILIMRAEHLARYHLLGTNPPLTLNVVRYCASLLMAERQISSTWHDSMLLSSAKIMNGTRASLKVAFIKWLLFMTEIL